MTCKVAVSNSPVFSPSRRLSIASSFFPSSSLSPRALSPLSSTTFRNQIAGDGSSPTAVLKRKRPARLDIPIMMEGFGASTTPRQAPEVAVVEEERDGVYSVYCKRGRRAALEDRFSALIDIQGNPKQGLFGVFDGHGGAKAAEYAAKNLDKNIMAQVEKRDEEDIKEAVKDIKEAVKDGYLKTDSEFLKEDLNGGSCCVTALITCGNLVVSNAGDCRAVMSRGGVAEALTTDHRPCREDEKERIEATGGFVDCYNGVWRIQGSLAVTRGIGDRQLKQWVISEPETRVIKIKSDDEFLILASDGLWEKVTNQEAVNIARPLCTVNDKLQLLTACKKLVDMAVSRGSLDDVSVMVIQLENYMQ